MKLGGVTAVVLAVCCLPSVSCDTGGGDRVPTPERGEPSVIKGHFWYQPSERIFTGGLGDLCDVDGQSYDLHGGAPVVVNDVAGVTIATGELESGVIVERNLGVPHGCRFAFTVEDVPISAYYEIKVGSVLASTSLTLSYDELEAADWTVEWGVGE